MVANGALSPAVSYYSPVQLPPSGTALKTQSEGSEVPKLFQPIRIRGVEFQNRIFVPPLCQYSADDGHLTPWHIAHLGGIISRGPGLTIIEATAVAPAGRITLGDVGIWSDSHIQSIRTIADFAHSQGQKIGIQLAHAGRKASMVAPWIGAKRITEEEGGWPKDVVGPSTEPYSDDYNTPRALTTQEVKKLVREWVEAAKRAVIAGVDVIEVHAAHGYLLLSFLSPVTNNRTDEYGGSFENRARFLLEIVDGIRAVIPDTMPLFVRVSATEHLETVLSEPTWTIDETIKLGGILAEHGVDLYDISTGGNHHAQELKILGPPDETRSNAYQAHFAEAIRKVHGVEGSETKKGKPALLLGAVGGIRDGRTANEVLEKGQADVVFVGRQFQRDPATVWTFADQLGVHVKVANQIEWGFIGRASRKRV